MSIILHIETATEDCSAALSKDGKLLGEQVCFDKLSHASILMPLIDKLLKNENLKTLDINAVSVSGGPGSYTGLRIGVSSAKGIGEALGVPLISTSTLFAAAVGIGNFEEIKSNDILFPAIDARRMEVYAMLLDSNFEVIKPVEALIMDESFFDNIGAERVLISGNACDKLKKMFNGNPKIKVVEQKVHMASNSIKEAYAKFLKKDFESTAYYEPFYLKSFVPGKPRVKGLE